MFNTVTYFRRYNAVLKSLRIKFHSASDFIFFLPPPGVYGSYWLHVKEAWEKRQHPNLHVMFYEDLKHDVMGEMKKLNTFLDTKLTDNQLKNIAKYTSFSEMKARSVDDGDAIFNVELVKKEGGFFRKGTVTVDTYS